MSAPPVLVVVPVYRAGPYLEGAIDGLRKQDFRHFRAVFVDDGTDDRDRAVLRAASAADPRIEVLHRAHEGLVAALEAGMAQRRGEAFVARFDADDEVRPQRLAAQVAYLQDHPHVDVLDSRYDVVPGVDGGEVGEGMARYARWHDSIEGDADFRREELVEDPICHPAVMVRARALDRLPPGPVYRDGPFPEDYDLWLRLRRVGARFHKLPQRLIAWRDHAPRATRTDPRYREAGFFPLKWAHLEQEHLRPGLRVAVWGGKQRARPWLRALKEGGHTLVGVVEVDPSVIGRTRQGAPVVGPDGLSSLAPDLVLLAVGSAGARALIQPVVDRLELPAIAVAGLAG